MTENRFEQLPWHDAVLMEIQIDRSGEDTVKVVVEWPSDYGGSIESLSFEGVYGFHAQMNFGVFPPDLIREAHCYDSCPELTEIILKWSKMGVRLEGLRCYLIETATTGSRVVILAQRYSLSQFDAKSCQRE